MVAVIVLLAYLFVIFTDFIPLIKTGRKKECWLYGICLLVSFAVVFLGSLGVLLPSPLIPLQDAFVG